MPESSPTRHIDSLHCRSFLVSSPLLLPSSSSSSEWTGTFDLLQTFSLDLNRWLQLVRDGRSCNGWCQPPVELLLKTFSFGSWEGIRQYWCIFLFPSAIIYCRVHVPIVRITHESVRFSEVFSWQLCLTPHGIIRTGDASEASGSRCSVDPPSVCGRVQSNSSTHNCHCQCEVYVSIVSTQCHLIQQLSPTPLLVPFAFECLHSMLLWIKKWPHSHLLILIILTFQSPYGFNQQPYICLTDRPITTCRYDCGLSVAIRNSISQSPTASESIIKGVWWIKSVSILRDCHAKRHIDCSVSLQSPGSA